MQEGSGLRDSVEVAVNAPPADSVGDNLAPLARPKDSSTRGKWVAYCVTLGAVKESLDGEAGHWNGELYEEYGRASKQDLIDLADRLGG